MQTSTKPPVDRPRWALEQLLAGNERYVADQSVRPDSRPSAAPQSPIAIVVSCSDSRVPSELVFDQGVGSLFVVRLAGNTYDRLAYESICFAVTRLGVPLIMVIGHDQCGAVTAAVESYPGPGVGPMLENIYPAVKAAHALEGDRVANAVNANAIMVGERLARERELVDRVSRRELWILPARYALATGAVMLLTPPPSEAAG